MGRLFAVLAFLIGGILIVVAAVLPTRMCVFTRFKGVLMGVFLLGVGEKWWRDERP